MTEVDRLRAECRAAREAGEFERAVEAGLKVWESAPNRDGWDAWNLAFALRKVKRHAEATKVVWAAFKIIADDPQAVASVGPRLASEFGWSAYYAELKEPTRTQPDRVLRASRAIVDAWDRYALQQPWATQYCPVPIAVNRAMKLLKEAEAWPALADLAQATDGDRMPDDLINPDSAGSAQGDWTRAEAWYTSAAKGLLETRRYGDALLLVERGLEREPALGPHCLKWLYVDGAKAAIGLGDGPRAVAMLDLARRSGVNDWWIGVTEATAAEVAGDRDGAIRALADALVTADRRHISPEFLCSALELTARLLATDDSELATLCAQAHRGIRERQGWGISEALDIASGGQSAPEAALNDIIAALAAKRRALEPRQQGWVTKVLNEGSGFLRDDEGTDRYFNFPRGVTMPAWCVADARVSFVPIVRTDRKDGVEKPAARDLESIEA
jgi:tetratricopeptide (TPR) repeat protein